MWQKHEKLSYEARWPFIDNNWSSELILSPLLSGLGIIEKKMSAISDVWLFTRICPLFCPLQEILAQHQQFQANPQCIVKK